MKHPLISTILALSTLTFPAVAQPIDFVAEMENALSDKALDADEYVRLQRAAEQPMSSYHATLAKHFLGFLSKLNQTTRATYTFYTNKNEKVVLKFLFSPHYAESQVIPGQTPQEKLSHVVQMDLLPETQYRAERNGAAILLAAHYLLYGHLDTLFEQLGLSSHPLTYGQMHLAQEALYLKYESDGKPGLRLDQSYQYYNDGRLENPGLSGEMRMMAEGLGLSLTPLLGNNRKTMTQRKAAILDYEQHTRQALYMVNLRMDLKTGQVTAPESASHGNFWALIMAQPDGSYSLYNSGVLENGNGDAIRKMTPQEVHQMLYNTPSLVAGIKTNRSQHARN